MAVSDRIARLPAPLRGPVRLALRSITGLYLLRYRGRLTCGPDVVIVGRLRLQQGTRLSLGARVRVRGTVVVNGGGTVRVGADTLLNGCWIGARTSVSIGERCLISDCDITDSDFHNLQPERRHDPPGDRTQAPIVIGDNVWVGFKSTVLKGVSIGTDSVVGARCVVRSDVEPRVVVIGDPATIVKRL